MQKTMLKKVPSDHKLIKNNDVFIVNPLFRLRNEHNFIKLYGYDGMGNYELHHTTGVILSLCNGKRTVNDIAKAVIPFLKNPQSDSAMKEALSRVKEITSYFAKTREEQRGEKKNRTEHPSEAALIPVSLLSEYGRYHGPEYDPVSFLPKHSYASGNFATDRKDRAPLKLNWHLTSACATNCRYCYLKRRKISNLQLLPLARVLELIEECKKIGVLGINPNGGDVLLYPYLYEFLEALSKGEFLPVFLSTKAYISKETAKKLAEYPIVFKVQYSIDSIVENIGDYLAGNQGFVKRALASIENALEAGLAISAKAVITPYNILTIPHLYRELRKKGIKAITLAMYSRSGFHHTEELFNHPESYDWLEKQLDILRQEFPFDDIFVQNGEPVMELPSKEIREKSFPSRSICTAGRSCMMICADGKVIPCEQMPEIEELFCGDLKNQSIQDVWNSKKLEEMTVNPPREKFEGSPCYDCEEFESCIGNKGYCFRDTYLFSGTIYTTPSNCPKFVGPFVRIV